jgi:Protein of unknown function (DUF732)
MRKLVGAGVTAVLCAVAWTTAPGAAAAPEDDAFLATITANGVPIYKQDYVIALGKSICDTARKYPQMEVVDLVLNDIGNENKPSPYSYQEGKVIATAALASYCPDAA